MRFCLPFPIRLRTPDSGSRGQTFKKGFGDKKRICYNCDEVGHFSDKCPYEKRLDKPKYEKGQRPILKPNPVNERYNKNTRREGKGLLGAAYMSDEESEDEDRVVGVSGLALAEPGSLFTYDYPKNYADDSPTPKSSNTCLMGFIVFAHPRANFVHHSSTDS